jgi:hypothetical protein
MNQSIVKTHRKLPLSNFQAVRDDIRKLYPAEMIADYDGVFYSKTGNAIDFHSGVYVYTSLRDELEALGLLSFWKSTALIVSNKELGIHSDGDPAFMHTIVIPVWNTENTFTEFFRCDDGPVPTILNHTDHDVHYDSYSIERCEFIDSVEIIEPVVINTDVPHRVVHRRGNDDVRVTAAIRLYDRKAVEIALRKLYNESL